jgi:hypothetical protein
VVRIRTSKESRIQEAKEAYDRMYEFKTNSRFGEFCKRLSAWDVQWRSRVARDNKPWDHATNYNVPITFHKVEDVHAVIMSFLNNPNFFSVAAAGGAIDQDTMRERSRLRTELLRWSLQNESCAQPFLDRFVHDGLTYGCGFGYLPWLILQRNMRSEEFLPDELRREKKMSDKDVLRLAMGPNLLKKRGLGDGVFEVTFLDDDGEEKSGRAYIDREHPNRPKGEPVLILERDVTYFNAPDPRNIAPWDIMVPPDARDLQTATRFWVRDFVSIGDLRRLSRLAIFNAVSAQDITALEADIAKSGGFSGRGDQDAVDEIRDQDFITQKIESRKDKLEIYYEYAMEPDADGYQNSIVRAFTNIRRPMLLMRQNVEYLYPHGRRPYFDWHMLPVDDRYYGMGIPEILEPTQNEANAYYQARSDVLEIITKPGGIYDPMSGLAPREIKYSPGMFIAVRDVDRAYRPFVFPTNPMPLFNEQAGVEAHAERVVGSTDMGLGRGSSRPNAPRTLGGTAILVRQQQVRMDVILRRLMYGRSVVGGGVSEFLRQYMDLYVALMPPEKEFRALGTGDVHKVQRADLQGRYDFVIDFGEEINNPQIRLQNAIPERGE